MALERSSQLTRMVAEKVTVVVLVIALLSSGSIPKAAGVDLSAPHATFYGGSDVSGTNSKSILRHHFFGFSHSAKKGLVIGN